MPRGTTVWITKFATTTGIFERDAMVIDDRMVRLANLPGEYGGIYYHKPFWHETREEAITHAKQLQAKKLVSLRRQLAKVEGLRFD